MPSRQRLLVPSKMSAPARRLTLAPFSFCRLPTGTTTLELVTSGRSVAIGALVCAHSSAAPTGATCQARATAMLHDDSNLGYSIHQTPWNATGSVFRLYRTAFPESWRGLSRPSTSCLLRCHKKDVDAREDGVPAA